MKSQNSRNLGFSCYICLLIEGSGSGSIFLTNGSGSRRPKNIRIRRIRIRKTGFHPLNFERLPFLPQGRDVWSEDPAVCQVWGRHQLGGGRLISWWRTAAGYRRTASRLSTDGQPTINGRPADYRRKASRLSTDCKPTIDRRQAGNWQTASRLSTDGQPTIDGRPANYRRTASRLSTDGQPSFDGRLAIWWSCDSCLHTTHFVCARNYFFRCSNKFFGDMTFLAISALSVLLILHFLRFKWVLVPVPIARSRWIAAVWGD